MKIVELLEMRADRLMLVRMIARNYRQWMETHGWSSSRSSGHRPQQYSGNYRDFNGMCNVHAAHLAEEYRKKGFPGAQIHGFEYYTDDLAYWNVEGKSFYKTDEEHAEAEPFEYGDYHEAVLIDNEIIVDVTADQFHPSDPRPYRSVVTQIGDPHYR